MVSKKIDIDKSESIVDKINPFRLFFKGIYSLFLWASGADLHVLEMAPMDKNKYFGIGGTIVFTALMASFAGGYAFSTAFDNVILSICFGVFWGALIFNLDRYIVSTFGVGDGKKTISKQEFKEALPRLLMAVILGFVISTPLELKLFEKEINAEIKKNIAISIASVGERSSTEGNSVINTIISENKSIKNRILHHESVLINKRREYDEADIAQRNEWNSGASSGKIGRGPLWKELDNKAKELKARLEKTEKEYRDLDSKDRKRIEEIEEILKKEYNNQLNAKEEAGIALQSNDGLMAKLKALDTLTSENTFLLAAKWLITLMFIFIEIAPILFKMMTERGAYDDILDRMKHEVYVRQMLMQSNLNEEINIEVKINADKNKQKLDAELLANKELLNKIALAQSEIANVAIDEWKARQIKMVKENPNVIIK